MCDYSLMVRIDPSQGLDGSSILSCRNTVRGEGRSYPIWCPDRDFCYMEREIVFEGGFGWCIKMRIVLPVIREIFKDRPKNFLLVEHQQYNL